MLVDGEELNRIARKLNLKLKAITDNFDSNTRSYTVSGKGFDNRYVPADEGNIIVDKASNLMWEQGGSKSIMNISGFIETWGINFAAAQQHVTQLNNAVYGGYNDWRLPTLEEALSLIEPTVTSEGVLKINQYFDMHQTTIWTSDRFTGNSYWSVDFDFGESVASPAYYELKARAVRSAP